MWLYVPPLSTSSPSAPAEPASISESDWRFPALEASAWWRGKPSRSRNWYQRWRRISFIRLLCGAMSEPSAAGAGVDAWTALLAASRASRTRSPDENREALTGATCGRRPAASSCRRGRGSSSSKTSAACSRRGMTKSLEPKGFGETFANWASRLRADCSRRRKSAQAMNASASSSSAWPTATAGAARKGADHVRRDTGNPNSDLPTAVSIWPTPLAADSGEKVTPASHQAGLIGAVHQWYTPNVPNGGRTLSAEATSTGMTPEGRKQQVGLENQARFWSTPRASDAEKGGPNQAFGLGGGRPSSGANGELGDAHLVELRRQPSAGQFPKSEHQSRSGGDAALASVSPGALGDAGREPGERDAGAISGSEAPRGRARQHHGDRAFGPANAGIGIFPPGPGDIDGWRAILERAPELEPAFCRVADGVAAWLDIARVDRLRMLGNGVVPLQAAYAFRVLAARLAARGSAGATRLVRMMGAR